MVNNTTGFSNIAIGNEALHDNVSGFDNVCIGEYAGTNVTGNYNTFLVTDAGYNGVGVSNNVYIGRRAGYSSSGSGNVFLGYHAGYHETGSNQLYIDNSTTATPLIHGDFSSNTVTINSILQLAPRTTPGTPTKGMIYFDSGTNKLRCYDGTTWNNLF